MPFVHAQPDSLTKAATDLANVGTALEATNAASVQPTTDVPAAGADEISAVIAAVFGAHARQYQAVGSEAADLHAQFVRAMSSASSAYTGAEAANAVRL